MDKVKQLENLLIKEINRQIYLQRDELIDQIRSEKEPFLFDNEIFDLTAREPYIKLGIKINVRDIISPIVEVENSNSVLESINNVFFKLKQVGWFHIEFSNIENDCSKFFINIKHRVTNQINDFEIRGDDKLISIKDLGFESSSFSFFLAAFNWYEHYIYAENYFFLLECFGKIEAKNIKKLNLFGDSLLHLTLAVMYHLPLVDDIIKFDDFINMYSKIDEKRTFLMRFQKISKGVIKYCAKFDVNYEQALKEIDSVSQFILWHIDLNNINDKSKRFNTVSVFNTLSNKIIRQINEKSEMTKIIGGLLRNKLNFFNSSIGNSKTFTEAWNSTYSILMDLLILANSIGVDKLNVDMKNLETKLTEKIDDVYDRCERVKKSLEGHLALQRQKIEHVEHETWRQSVGYFKIANFIGDYETPDEYHKRKKADYHGRGYSTVWRFNENS